jgi:hypothetical protein
MRAVSTMRLVSLGAGLLVLLATLSWWLFAGERAAARDALSPPTIELGTATPSSDVPARAATTPSRVDRTFRFAAPIQRGERGAVT